MIFENPNPCLMCCSVRNYLGPSGTGEATFHRLVHKYARHLHTCILHFAPICCKLPENPKAVPILSSFNFTFIVHLFAKVFKTVYYLCEC